MARPLKPIEQRLLNGRGNGRDSAGTKLHTPVTQLPGTTPVPEVPAELVTTGNAEDCYAVRSRNPKRPCEVCLGEVGLAAWTRLWTAGSAWLSAKADIDILTRICRARIDEAHLRAIIDEDGPFTRGQRGGLVAHPAVNQLRALSADVMKLESLCGFNPAERGRLNAGGGGVGGETDDIVARRTAPRVTAPVPPTPAPRKRAVGARRDEVD